jgi:cystathionine beta-synthase
MSLLDLIGNTPLVELTRFDTGLCRLFVKLECQNPGGSIKDRIALAMVEAAEREGRLQPGGLLVEATSGNTGIALAMVAALRGYRLLLVVFDKTSDEKIALLRAMGAEVIVTRSDVQAGHPEYYRDMAARLAGELPGAVLVNQFGNPANPAAHAATTGPEIWAQTGGTVDAVVAGIGSGGTLTGIGRYFSQVAPWVEMVLADPVGSNLAALAGHGQHPPDDAAWLVEGIGQHEAPEVCDLSFVKHAYSIGDAESVYMAQALLRQEGILAGSSSGTLVAAALRHCLAQTMPKTVVTFICDSGSKYLSKLYNPDWLAKNGLINAGTA